MKNNSIQTLLTNALQANQHHFSSAIIDQLVTYLELLHHWNKTFNLTAIRNVQDMVTLHILDSLAVQPFLHGKRILDVGTGAGLPGIPLALINPEREFVLLDSNSKKTRFLTHVVQTLAVQNVEIVHSRCQQFYSATGFDTIVSRAFAELKVMLAETAHLVSRDGQFLAMKGHYPRIEIEEMPDGFQIEGVYPLAIAGLKAERCVVVIRKN